MIRRSGRAIARADIVAEALRWVDTPYRHQASACQVGCDCLGLVRGIWRRFYGEEPQTVPAYTPDWAERHGRESLHEAADRYLVRAPDTPLPGDVLLFRMAPDAPAKHCGVLIAEDRFVHAYWARAVCVHHLTAWWQRRLAARYSFPELMDHGCTDH